MTLGQFTIANTLLKALLEYSICLQEVLKGGGLGYVLPQEPCVCSRISFILLRAARISTGRRPGTFSWVRIPGTPAVKHWLPAQLVVQTLANLLAQTQCTQTGVDSCLACTGTGSPIIRWRRVLLSEVQHPAIYSVNPLRRLWIEF